MKFTKNIGPFTVIDYDKYFEKYPVIEASKFERILECPLSQLTPNTYLFFEHEGKTLFPIFQITSTGSIFTFVSDAIYLSKGLIDHKVLYVYMCNDIDELNGNIAKQLPNAETDSSLYEKLIVHIDMLVSRNSLD